MALMKASEEGLVASAFLPYKPPAWTNFQLPRSHHTDLATPTTASHSLASPIHKMRERDRRKPIRGPSKLELPRKDYPPGTPQYRLQHATNETAAEPPNPTLYIIETPESSLCLELFRELHTHDFKNGVFESQLELETPPLTTLQLLLDSPHLSQHEKFFVQEFKREYETGMGEDNIFSYIMAFDAFLKMLRRDAVARNILSELPPTEIIIRSDGKLPTTMSISAESPPVKEGDAVGPGGEITFIGIGDTRIRDAFDEYRKDWRVQHNVPLPPRSPPRLEPPSSDSESESEQGKSLELLNEILRNKTSDVETLDDESVIGEPDSDYHD